MYNLGNIKHFLGAFWPTQIDSKKECPCSLTKHEQPPPDVKFYLTNGQTVQWSGDAGHYGAP